MKEEKIEEIEQEEIRVVAELPTVQVRKLKDDLDNKFSCITIEEAMSEMYNDIKAIKKALA